MTTRETLREEEDTRAASGGIPVPGHADRAEDGDEGEEDASGLLEAAMDMLAASGDVVVRTSGEHSPTFGRRQALARRAHSPAGSPSDGCVRWRSCSCCGSCCCCSPLPHG